MAPRHVRLFSLFGVAALTDCAGPALPPEDTAAPEAGADDAVVASWAADVQHRIEASQYVVQVGEDGALVGRGAALQLNTTWRPEGVSIVASDNADEIGLSFVAWGREGAVRPVAPVEATQGACDGTGAVDVDGHCLPRVEYARDGLVEWWANRPEGLQQGFDLVEEPAGDGWLELDVRVDGADVELDPSGAAVRLVQTGRDWTYAELAAWDADGRELPALFDVEGDHVRILVDDTDATWPVYVDPLASTPAQTINGLTTYSAFGRGLAAGDINGDGFADVIVGAPGYDSANPNVGRAYGFLGSAAGLATTPIVTYIYPNEGVASGADDLFGYTIAAGRLNGDSYADVVISAPSFNAGDGIVYVFMGAAVPIGGADGSLTGSTDMGLLGYSLAVGDLDGANHDEIVAGAPDTYVNPRTNQGRVWIWSDADGTWPAVTAPTRELSAPITNKDNVFFGESVAVTSGAVTLDGDSTDDLVVGMPRTTGEKGEVYVYYDNSSLSSISSPDMTFKSTVEGESFGMTLAISRKSVEGGNSYPDLLIGAPNVSGSIGRAYLAYFPDNDQVDKTFSGAANDDKYFGIALAFGDFNKDGFDDAAIGSPQGSTAPVLQGRVHVYDGGTKGPDTTKDWSYASGESLAELGWAAVAADINKDGDDELIVGAPYAVGGGTDNGTVFVFDDAVPDLDLDGFTIATGDCKENDATYYPGAPETTLGVDKDCDGKLMCAEDLDGDTYGSSKLVEETDSDKSCNTLLAKTADDALDCDDTSALVNPGITEIVYGKDNDCDSNLLCYVDSDKDGFGSTALVEETDKDKNCDEKADGVANDNTDCADADAAYYPGATETTYGQDRDCDGSLLCYADADQDGYGSSTLFEETDADKNCDESADKTANDNTDCDDAAFAIKPGATEDTYGLDKNCDGNLLCYVDGDKDGSGSTALVQETDKDKNCDEKADGVANDPGDCLDSNAAYYPGAPETTYNQDRDCDGNLTCYADLDQDKFGSTTLVEEVDKDGNCDEFGDKVANDNTDCLDSNVLAFPGATEIVGDGIDESCDGAEVCYIDNDQDTWGAFTTKSESGDADLLCETADKEATKSGDCNDNNAGITNTGTTEVVGDGIDQDCDSFDQCYADKDKDGHANKSGVLVADSSKDGCNLSQGEAGVAIARDDCDDNAPSVYTGAPELVSDGLDNDCNGAELCYVDGDKDAHAPTSKATVTESADLDFTCETGDGEAALAGPFDDCDDASGVRYPGNTEVCGNGIDENCDGAGQGATADDDADGLDFGKETASGSNDCVADADGDGVKDGAEYGVGASAQNTDGDAFVDILDPDDDNDGVITKTEGAVADTDSDGKKNYLDADDDGDGVLSASEGASTSLDTDNDKTLDYLDTDDEGDGVSTLIEGTGDLDLDLIKNYLDPDDDGDGVSTLVEGSGDLDVDGVKNYLDADDDGDGVPTLTEGTKDTDNDKTADYVDVDDDGDGVDTKVEGTGDQDKDGKPNYLDLDDDGDGVQTKSEVSGDTDLDGLANFLDADDDGDGIPTATEGATADSDSDAKVDYLDADDDGDGVPTLTEGSGDTDKDTKANYLDTDDDGDGVSTLLEDPDKSGNGANDDTDQDKTPNYLDTDDDGDFIATASEDTNGNKNWFDDDVDKDAVPDFLDNDDDNDGVPSFAEDTNGNRNPRDDDSDLDGTANYLDTDDDGDGIPTFYEYAQFVLDGGPNLCGFSANYLSGDSDGDGVSDAQEWTGTEGGVLIGTFGSPRDTDGDGCVNAIDEDDDQDGFPTFMEGGEGTQFDVDGDPTKGCAPAPDGFPNYLDNDSDGDAKDNGLVTKDAYDADGPGGDPPLPGINGRDGAETYEQDADDDGIFDVLDCLDNDGCDGDIDGDGLTNCEERALGSLGTSKDSDGDGLTDDVEIGSYANPRNTDGDLYWTDVDGDGDLDGGEWIDANNDNEMQASEYTGTLWVDTDGDRMMDPGEGEVRPRYNLIDPDDDGDHVATSTEITGLGTGTVTNPADTDGDGLDDYLDTDDDDDGVPTIEEEPRSPDNDPTNDDSDGDEVPDYLDPDRCTDCDGDGIADLEELDCGLDPLRADYDNDGLSDGREVCSDVKDCDLSLGKAGDGICDVLAQAVDHDGDTVPDVFDTDDDGDGVSTKDEGDYDQDGDGIPNALDLDSDRDGIDDSAESITDDPDCDGAPSLLDFDETDGPCAQDERVGGTDTDGPDLPSVPACGCQAAPDVSAAGALLVGLLGLVRRRRR